MNKEAEKCLKSNSSLDMEEIINSYNSYIYTIIKNSIDSNEDIEEILSDVYVALWQNREKIDLTTDLKPYLIGITRNLIKKKYRSLEKNIPTFDIYEFENVIESKIDISQIIENSEKKQIMLKTINDLKEYEKEIFTLYYYDNKKIKEISEYMRISITKVKVTLHRVRKKIKKELKKGGYSYG